MSSNNRKVVPLTEQIQELNEVTHKVTTEIFPGFSTRLNQLIDLTDLGIPPLDDGRQAHISSLLQASKMAPGDWLKKDKPPKTSTLRKLVIYLLSHIAGDHSPYKIEAWLKYGDAALSNPFTTQRAMNNQALIPLATTLIVGEAKAINVPTNRFDLSKVLEATLETLSNFQLTQESMVEPVHKKIIAQYILAHPK
ncbi:MAG: hypothetical protein KTR20_00895 [Cellvibrionaceae bacterium]|nr:hypothetical protein [Cellvibrionaceae bacterium]